MKIQLLMSDNNTYKLNWDKNIDSFKDEILFCDPKKTLLTESGDYAMTGQIVSFKVLEE